eukprot:1561827-Pyramimonas_sp.AAC.1
MDHVFSAEIDYDKQHFIMDMFPTLKLVFGDMTTLHPLSATAQNAVDGQMHPAPRNVDIFFEGPPCDDVSLKSKQARSGANDDVVAQGSARTGSCFAGLHRAK